MDLYEITDCCPIDAKKESLIIKDSEGNQMLSAI